MKIKMIGGWGDRKLGRWEDGWMGCLEDRKLGRLEDVVGWQKARELVNAIYEIYPSRIGFRFSEPDFTRTLDLSQSQNPRFDSTKAVVLFNRKIKISGKFLP